MRIAVVVSEFPSLHETFVLDHITGLMDRGHDVDIYATAPTALPKCHDEIKRYGLLDRTVYRESKEFTPPRNPILRTVKAVPLLSRGLLKNPRGTLNSLNVMRLGKEASSLTALYKVAPFLNFGAYDIVHCHGPRYGQFAVFLRQLGAIKGKIVTSFHGYSRRVFAKSGTKQPFDDLFKNGDLFLFCSEHMKQWFDQNSGDGTRMIVQRCGVRTSRFSASKPKPNDSGFVRLLSVGRLVEKKGFEYAIRGIAKVLRSYPKIRYEIAGDGPEKSKLERLITELGVTNNIKLLGWQEREEISRLLGEAHIFLAPSVTSPKGDQEGIPVVLMEAMASGLPVISTYHTGIPEIVNHGESGFLVEERDVEDIADRLTRLMKRRELWQEMGLKGRKHIEEHYNLDRQNDRLVKIYRSLLKHGSAFLFSLALLGSLLQEYLPFFVEIA
jgi:colanic acid/amylovoran biosynthesis glycosyltransferase